jgi:hypothetical protein
MVDRALALVALAEAREHRRQHRQRHHRHHHERDVGFDCSDGKMRLTASRRRGE